MPAHEAVALVDDVEDAEGVVEAGALGLGLEDLVDEVLAAVGRGAVDLEAARRPRCSSLTDISRRSLMSRSLRSRAASSSATSSCSVTGRRLVWDRRRGRRLRVGRWSGPFGMGLGTLREVEFDTGGGRRGTMSRATGRGLARNRGAVARPVGMGGAYRGPATASTISNTRAGRAVEPPAAAPQTVPFRRPGRRRAAGVSRRRTAMLRRPACERSRRRWPSPRGRPPSRP